MGEFEDKETGRNVLIKREKAKCDNERHELHMKRVVLLDS